MKNRLRLALPPLAQITPESLMTFALFNRAGQLQRSGELPLGDLAKALPVENVQAVLHPDDTIVVTISLPPLQARRLDAAVEASVEPMALSDISNLCIAHGPRAADGNLCVAWTDRRSLLQAWQHLGDAGLTVVALVPHSLALPKNDPDPAQPLTLPVDARWEATLPRWSLARPEWRPVTQTRRWRGAALWGSAAALLWLAGVQIHATQLRNEVLELQTATEEAVITAFPSIAIVIDPVQQARNERDMLRLAGGIAGEDDFMPMALATAKVLRFADGHVVSLRYENDTVTVTLAEGYAPPANEAALDQAAAVQSLVLKKNDNIAHTWHIRRASQSDQTERGTRR